ncbi:MAG: tRNA (N(6)-L-threonylcarbamoyladenosine(37)-C(2))-methylthiotransferase MtaB [Oscillospiraceae bacterium]|nr:tRNA (N(6)-L-threonylcarbamoyladenosine(37)-C(2))-methylthiotransferase MtaB [Oscillospiraceae bacterium]
MQYQVYTLGCKVNQTESAGLSQMLRAEGHTLAENGSMPELLLVNSCAVTAESVRKAKQLLRSLRRKHPNALIVLTGCWPQAFPEDDFADADFVTGTKNRDALLQFIAAHGTRTAITETQIAPYQSGEAFSPLPCADTERTRAFLKIQDGCNQFCTYCIIPYARGRCRSMPPERLAIEAKSLAAQGFREIVLTGINLGFFGMDTGQTLAEAVAVCAAEEGVCRVRLGSLEPERMTEDTLLALRSCGKFCPQFHLSLQSGSDAVLKRMNRRYDTAQYRALAERIHALFPDAALTTDVIVGFPGETDADFAETLAFVREMGFAKVHVFPYSPREGTKAAAFPDQVDPRVKNERAAALSQLADEIRRAHLAKYVGKTAEVLVENEKHKDTQVFYQGHTADGTLVKIFAENAEKGLQNSLICVTIEGYETDALTGHTISGGTV